VGGTDRRDRTRDRRDTVPCGFAIESASVLLGAFGDPGRRPAGVRDRRDRGSEGARERARVPSRPGRWRVLRAGGGDRGDRGRCARRDRSYGGGGGGGPPPAPPAGPPVSPRPRPDSGTGPGPPPRHPHPTPTRT